MKKQIVVEYFGGPSAVAKALNISPASVSQWPDLVPKWRAYQIEKITRGKLKLDPALYQKPATAA